MSDDKKNAFEGSVRIKNRDTGKEREAVVTMPNLDQDHPLTCKSDRTARAHVSLTMGRNVDYGSYSYKLSMGGSVDVTEEDFFSGEAHNELADHISKVMLPFIEILEDDWIPADYQIPGAIRLELPAR